MMSEKGFILITVMIFVLLLSLLVEQAFYAAQLEQRLFLTLEKRQKLLELAEQGIITARRGKLICNSSLCVRSTWKKDYKIITSKAIEGDMQICIQNIFLNETRIEWLQLEKC